MTVLPLPEFQHLEWHWLKDGFGRLHPTQFEINDPPQSFSAWQGIGTIEWAAAHGWTYHAPADPNAQAQIAAMKQAAEQFAIAKSDEAIFLRREINQLRGWLTVAFPIIESYAAGHPVIGLIPGPQVVDPMNAHKLLLDLSDYNTSRNNS